MCWAKNFACINLPSSQNAPPESSQRSPLPQEDTTVDTQGALTLSSVLCAGADTEAPKSGSRACPRLHNVEISENRRDGAPA